MRRGPGAYQLEPPRASADGLSWRGRGPDLKRTCRGAGHGWRRHSSRATAQVDQVALVTAAGTGESRRGGRRWCGGASPRPLQQNGVSPRRLAIQPKAWSGPFRTAPPPSRLRPVKYANLRGRGRTRCMRSGCVSPLAWQRKVPRRSCPCLAPVASAVLW
jgi:hypothetical protein